MNLVRGFITNESGSTAVEYALIAAGIALAAYVSLLVASALTTGLLGAAIANLSPTSH